MIVNQNRIQYEIDKEKCCANVIKLNKAIENVFIPRLIQNESQNYPIKKIS